MDGIGSLVGPLNDLIARPPRPHKTVVKCRRALTTTQPSPEIWGEEDKLPYDCLKYYVQTEANLARTDPVDAPCTMTKKNFRPPTSDSLLTEGVE